MNPGLSYADFQHLEDSQPMRKQDLFSPLSAISEHSFEISEEWYQFFSFRSFTTSLLLLLNLHICYRQGESSDINEKETAAVFNGLLESDLSISELPSNIGRRKLIKEYLEGKIPSLQTDGVKVFCSIKYS